MSLFSKKNALTIVLVVLIVLNVAALATFIFWPGHLNRMDGKARHERRDPGEFLKSELSLSEEQSAQMDKLKKQHRDTLSVWAEKMRAQRNLLSMEMMKSSPDSALVNATSDTIGDIYAVIRKLNVIHYWEMKKICNDEQKKKLDTIFKGIFCCDDAMYGRFNKFSSHGCMKDKQGCGAEKEKKNHQCGKE